MAPAAGHPALLNTTCPRCATVYRVDEDGLLKANCLAHCYRCGTLFAVVGRHAAEVESSDIALVASALRLGPREQVRLRPPVADATTPPPGLTRPAAAAPAPAPAESRPPPFELAEDLAPLEPSADAALDIAHSLEDAPRGRRWPYTLLALLLAMAFGLQLAWQYRDSLLQRFPELEPLCTRLPCRPALVRAPEQLRILQRDVRPTANQPGSLSLSARIRNESEFAQPLPDIQLSLLDNDGGVVLRRRLAPAEYLYPPPAEDQTLNAGEVITISIDFQDPGHLASGFQIDLF